MTVEEKLKSAKVLFTETTVNLLAISEFIRGNFPDHSDEIRQWAINLEHLFEVLFSEDD